MAARGPKMANGVWKGVYPLDFWALPQFSKHKDFIWDDLHFSTLPPNFLFFSTSSFLGHPYLPVSCSYENNACVDNYWPGQTYYTIVRRL